jgi:hypothetical protein
MQHNSNANRQSNTKATNYWAIQASMIDSDGMTLQLSWKAISADRDGSRRARWDGGSPRLWEFAGLPAPTRTTRLRFIVKFKGYSCPKKLSHNHPSSVLSYLESSSRGACEAQACSIPFQYSFDSTVIDFPCLSRHSIPFLPKVLQEPFSPPNQRGS